VHSTTILTHLNASTKESFEKLNNCMNFLATLAEKLSLQQKNSQQMLTVLTL